MSEYTNNRPDYVPCEKEQVIWFKFV